MLYFCFRVSFCFLALIANSLASPSEYSGLLSRLYKKAASENRPLILVLDNSANDLEETPRAVKTREVNVEIDKNVPLNLLELLNSKRLPLKHDHKQVSFDYPLAEQQVEPSYSDLELLKLRLERERQRRERKARKDRRERKQRAQVTDDEDQKVNILQEDKKNQEENRDRKRDRLQNRLQDRNQDRDQDRYRPKEEDKLKTNNEKRALRTSVIKNLLRTFNDLNCDAKDECQDECGNKYNGKKQYNCENKCEAKYECEDSEEEDPCKKDECDNSEETGSTKGERLVTVTEKCKRC